jgi:hypothetical protein
VLREFEKGGQTVAQVAATLRESESYVRSVVRFCKRGDHRVAGVTATDVNGVITLHQEEITWTGKSRVDNKPLTVLPQPSSESEAADSITLKWHSLEPADRVRTGALGFAGVYAWIWPGTPDRVRYIGMSRSNVGSRLGQEFKIYRAGGFNQFNMSDKDTDFFSFFAKYWNVPTRVLLGVASLPGDAIRLAWAASSLPQLRFTWAEVPASAAMAVEAKLISDVRSQIRLDTGWDPPQKFKFPAKIDNRMTSSERYLLARLSLTHQGFPNASALFGPAGQRRC